MLSPSRRFAFFGLPPFSLRLAYAAAVCVFAPLVVHETDSLACSVRAVRPTRSEISDLLEIQFRSFAFSTIVARLRSSADKIIALTTVERSFIAPCWSGSVAKIPRIVEDR